MAEETFRRRFTVLDSRRDWLNALPWASTALVVDGYLRVTPRMTAHVSRRFQLSPDRLRQVAHESRLEISVVEPVDHPSGTGNLWLRQKIVAFVIPAAIAEQALLESPFTKVHKQTSLVNIDGLSWVIDDYRWANDGLMIATYTGTSKEIQALQTPAWCGTEIAEDSRFSEAQLATHPLSNRPPSKRRPTRSHGRVVGIRSQYDFLKPVTAKTHVEIERRFIATLPQALTDPDLIIQDYLVSGEQVAIRLRLQGPVPASYSRDQDPGSALLVAAARELRGACVTVKGKRTGVARVEIEHEVDPDFARAAMTFDGDTLIVKKRFNVIDVDLWTLDAFMARNSPLVIAECEVESEASAEAIDPPEFCIREILNDHRYDNDQLAITPFGEWGG